MKKLGELVSQLRTQRGYETQKAFAVEIDKDPSWVSRLEKGTTKETPDPDSMRRIAKALGVREVELLEAAGYQIEDADAETITINRDDPRARLLLTVMPLPDDEVERWANAIAHFHEGKR